MANDALTDFDTFQHQFLGASHTVYRKGEGPPVLVLAEIPGITPAVADFARRLVRHDMTVFMPHIYGTDGRQFSYGAAVRTIALACVSREFAALRLKTTAPATLWLRDLMRRSCSMTGYHGAGVVGMCFTGGFALAMLMEPELIAPVLSQPSLPIGPTSMAHRSLAMDPGDIKDARLRAEADDVSILGLRFTGDALCRGEKFDAITDVFGDRFIRVEIDSSQPNPHGIRKLAHSVLTEDFVDEEGHPTRDAMNQVIAFLSDRLHAPANRVDDPNEGLT